MTREDLAKVAHAITYARAHANTENAHQTLNLVATAIAHSLLQDNDESRHGFLIASGIIPTNKEKNNGN